MQQPANLQFDVRDIRNQETILNTAKLLIVHKISHFIAIAPLHWHPKCFSFRKTSALKYNINFVNCFSFSRKRLPITMLCGHLWWILLLFFARKLFSFYFINTFLSDKHGFH